MAIPKTAALAALFMIMTCQVAFAHHLWIEKSADNQYAVVRGVLPDRADAYDPDCVQEVNAFGRDGQTIPVKRIDEKDRVIFKTGEEAAMVAACSKWGYRVNTTKGKRLMGKKQAKEEGLTVLSAFFSTHYAKSLFAPSDAAKKPAGLRFEILPLKDPQRANPGDEIAFKVIFDKKPLPGISLYTQSGDTATADSAGTALLTMPDSDTVLLYARHRIDVKGDDQKDYEIFTTFLTFEVKP